MSIEQDYTKALAQFRRQKDDYFRTAPESPIPLDERAAFKGLRYYPPLFALRLVAQVERLPASAPIQMATSDGAFREFVKAATLRFTIDGQEHTLTGYQGAEEASDAAATGEAEDAGDAVDASKGEDAGDAEEVTYFIPFRDALSGKETYGAGRYMDVHVEQGATDQPIAILDFNLAYNPYCAYNDNFSCPITPPENALPVAIYAGERNYHE